MTETNNQEPAAPEGRLQAAVGRYQLDVQVSPYEGDRYAFSKGHHDRDAFLAALEIEIGDSLTAQEIRHEWWRYVPAPQGDEHGGYYAIAKPHSRGAFPVTCADLTPNDAVSRPEGQQK